MLSVLIVDDEKNLCSLIQSIINWDRLGLKVIGEAYNGLTAYESICKNKPDIVIMDIRMPGMDGLELLDKVKKNTSRPRFIIISGYRYFDYAYTAIKHGVEDFLLKPINKEELTTALRRIVLELCGQHSDKNISQLTNQTLTQPRNRSRKQLIFGMLQNQLQDITIAQTNSEYGFSFENTGFIALALRLDENWETSALGKKLLSRATTQFIDVLSTECTEVESCEHKNTVYLILNFSPEKESTLHRLISNTFSEVMSLLTSYSFFHFTVLVSSVSTSFDRVAYLFTQLGKALEAKPVIGVNRIINIADQNWKQFSIENTLKSEWRSQLIQRMQVLDVPAIYNLIDELFASLSEALASAPYLAFELAEKMLLVFYNSPLDFSLIDQSAEEMHNTALKMFLHCTSLASMIALLKERFSEALSGFETLKEGKETKIIELAKQYISKNFDRQITLEEVAGKIHFNPVYFSTLFRKLSGEKFMDYLINIRIDAAKQMLKNTEDNIAQISKNVGYKDPKYFAKLFKKQIGLKPTEYRKLHQTGYN